MKTKHSALIGLQATRAALNLAAQECAHWDYESDGDSRHDCCYNLQDAKAAHRAQLARWRKEQEEEARVNHIASERPYTLAERREADKEWFAEFGFHLYSEADLASE